MMVIEAVAILILASRVEKCVVTSHSTQTSDFYWRHMYTYTHTAYSHVCFLLRAIALRSSRSTRFYIHQTVCRLHRQADTVKEGVVCISVPWLDCIVNSAMHLNAALLHLLGPSRVSPWKICCVVSPVIVAISTMSAIAATQIAPIRLILEIDRTN